MKEGGRQERGEERRGRENRAVYIMTLPFSKKQGFSFNGMKSDYGFHAFFLSSYRFQKRVSLVTLDSWGRAAGALRLEGQRRMG